MDMRFSQNQQRSSLKPKTINPKLERTKEGLFCLLGQEVPKENYIQIFHSIGKPISLSVSVPGHHADGLGILLNKKLGAEGLPIRLQMDATKSEGETKYSFAIVPQEEYLCLDHASAIRFAGFFMDRQEALSLPLKHLVHYDAAERALTALPGILKDIRQRKEYHPEKGIQS